MEKKISLEEFEKRLVKIFPFSKIQVIKFDGLNFPLEYRCIECERKYFIKRADGLFSRINPCKKCNHFYSREQKIRYFESLQDDLQVIKINRVKSDIYCKKCGKRFERTTVSLMSYFDNCPNCNNRFKKQMNSLQESQDILSSHFLGHSYQLLEYEGYQKSCKIKCLECHFIYIGSFSSFLNSRGCPRCKRKISKGEDRIKKWLEQNSISFIYQKSLDLEENLKRYKFDFFLPDYNLAIEYQGEQHYIDKRGVFDTLENNQKRDKKKQDYCSRQGIELLIIPYWDLKNIESILNLKLND